MIKHIPSLSGPPRETKHNINGRRLLHSRFASLPPPVKPDESTSGIIRRWGSNGDVCIEWPLLGLSASLLLLIIALLNNTLQHLANALLNSTLLLLNITLSNRTSRAIMLAAVEFCPTLPILMPQ